MSVDVVTFGCRLNIVESEAVRRAAEGAGVADAVIVNTCAVTGEAVRQARQAIRRLRRDRPDTPIVVTGCAAQADGAQFAAMPEVDRVLGNEDKFDRAAWQRDDRVAVSDIMTATAMRPQAVDTLAGHTRGFVQVQNGCDHRCTFCIIPFGRGNSRSLPIVDVIAQARRLVDNGYREIVLTGVDITSYADGDMRLGTLVKRLLRDIPELERLRLSSIDSVEADRDLLDALSFEPGDGVVLRQLRHREDETELLASSRGHIASAEWLKRLSAIHGVKGAEMSDLHSSPSRGAAAAAAAAQASMTGPIEFGAHLRWNELVQKADRTAASAAPRPVKSEQSGGTK